MLCIFQKILCKFIARQASPVGSLDSVYMNHLLINKGVHSMEYYQRHNPQFAGDFRIKFEGLIWRDAEFKTPVSSSKDSDIHWSLGRILKSK